MSRRAALLSVLLLAGAAAAQEQTGQHRQLVSDVAEPDLNRAMDVVILAEGWRSAERDEFFQLAKKKLARRIRSEAAAEPLRETSGWNFHYLFVNSAAGAAPWRPGRPARDTAFKTYVDAEGTMLSDDAAADELAAELAPDVDLVVILVKLLPVDETLTAKKLDKLRHQPKHWQPASPDADVASPDDVRPNADVPLYGGRVRITTLDTEAFIHEVGHAAYGLGDEYDELDEEIPADEKWDVALTPNLTCDSSGARWRHIISTPPFEGGAAYARGVWRPEKHCRMRESRSQDFCAVCMASIRGSWTALPPSRPVITAPTEAARVNAPRVTASLHRLDLPFAWRDGPGGGDPVSFHVVLRRVSTGREVWSDDIEGHLRRAEASLRLKTGGAYLLGVRADGAGGQSEFAWRRVEVELGGPAGGILGAVDQD